MTTILLQNTGMLLKIWFFISFSITIKSKRKNAIARSIIALLNIFPLFINIILFKGHSKSNVKISTMETALVAKVTTTTVCEKVPSTNYVTRIS